MNGQHVLQAGVMLSAPPHTMQSTRIVVFAGKPMHAESFAHRLKGEVDTELESFTYAGSRALA